MLKELIDRFTPYEWILTNQRGGYALGSAFLGNYRKYHGLLIAGKEAGKRFHLVGNIEERVVFPSGLEYFLDTNFYKDIVYPEGHRLIKKFFLRPYPQFFYFCPKSEDLFLKKSVRMHPFKNVTVVEYQNISSYPFKLYLRPKLTFRNHHTLNSRTFWEKSSIEVELNSRIGFVYGNDLCLFVAINRGMLKKEEIFYYDVYYPLEEIRGYEAFEDLFSPFVIEVELSSKEIFHIVFGDEPIFELDRVLEETFSRYREYPNFIPNKKEKLSYQEYLRILELILEEFLIEGDAIAGYPWFYCWGRDTFISLPAFLYLKDGPQRCVKIFKNYSSRLSNGLIPNVIGGPSETNYDSVDATLWFGIRVFQFLEKYSDIITKDERELLTESVKTVIENFLTNPLLPFKVDPEDGFIEIPSHVNKALTWMDVMIDGFPLTPRYGKPIEIQGLWHNLLKYAERNLPKNFLDSYKLEHYLKAQKQNFKKFFNGEIWADRIFEKVPIFEVRPNYLVALSLPFDLCGKEELKKAIEVAKRELLTPYGLRSLSPRDPKFRGNYFGSQRTRDLAYHNGTVWVWLIYPYAQVLRKVLDTEKENLKVELNDLVKVFRDLISTGKAASIPEIYDGENPYYPKGAHAQLWSVAAVFLIEKMLQDLK